MKTTLSPLLRAGLLAMLPVFLASARAENWPRFRGPGGRGIRDDTAIPTVITADDYRWRTELPGGGQSSPAIWDDRIYLTCAREEGRRELVCLDAGNGQILWTYEDRFTPHRLHDDNSYVSATPAVDADRVYLWWTDGKTYRATAVDKQGKQIWQRELGTFDTKFGSGSSPVLAGGLLVVTHELEGEGGLIAGLDPATGDTKWKLDRRSVRAAYSTPTPRKDAKGGLELIFTSTAHGITAVDPASGKVRWSDEDAFTQRCTASAVVMGDLVFAVAGAGGSGKEAYTLRAGSPPERLYKLKKDLPNVPTPVARDGRIYLWADSGTISCVRLETGEVLWSEKPVGHTYSSPLWIGGRVYGIDREGLMVVLEAGDTYKELGRHQFEKGTSATPAVVDGRLYVRLDDILICIGK